MFRLYTEDVNRPRIIAILNNFFAGYTLMEIQGRYRDRMEQSLLIEVWGADEKTVHYAASEICRLNNQEVVGIQHLKDIETIIHFGG